MPLKQKESAQHSVMFRKKKQQTGTNGLSVDNERGYLPMQKLEKMRPNRSSELNAPVISPSDCCA